MLRSRYLSSVPLQRVLRSPTSPLASFTQLQWFGSSTAGARTVGRVTADGLRGGTLQDDVLEDDSPLGDYLRDRRDRIARLTNRSSLDPDPVLVVEVIDGATATTLGRYAELAFSSVDRGVYQAGILGVGDLSFGFGQEGGIQPCQTDLTLVDVDGALGALQAAGSLFNARVLFWLALPDLGFAEWVRWGPTFRIESFNGRDETSVSLSLVAADADALGAVVTVPNLGNVDPLQSFTRESQTGVANYQFLSSPPFRRLLAAQGPGSASVTLTHSAAKRLPGWGVSTGAQPIPVVFGNEATPVAWGYLDSSRLPRAGGGQVTSTENPHGFLVLGASRNPRWMTPHWYSDGDPANNNGVITLWRGSGRETVRVGDPVGTFATATEEKVNAYRAPKQLLGPASFMPGERRGGRNGVLFYVDVVRVPDPDRTASAYGSDWYVAVLVIMTGGLAGGLGLPVELEYKYDPRADFEVFMVSAKRALDAGELWWNFPTGAAGWSDELHGRERVALRPALLLRHLAAYYGGPSWQFIDEASALEAGSIVRGTPSFALTRSTRVAEVIEDICQGFDLDVTPTVAGDYKILPAAPTARDLIDRIDTAKAIDLDRWLVDGSWDERVELGDSRWGLATEVEIEGVKPPLKTFVPELSEEPIELDVDVRGRRLIRGLNVKALDQWFNGNPEVASSVVRQRAADLAGRGGRLLARFALPLWAFSIEPGALLSVSYTRASTPWVNRLCRVERVTLSWSSRTVSLEVVDVDDWRSKRPFILDDQAYWIRSTTGTVAISAVSLTVTGTGTRFQSDGVAAGDLLWIQRTMSVKVASVASDTSLTLDALPPATGAGYAFRVYRSHDTRPDAAAFPGRYVDGKADIYGVLADSLGELGSGEDGYQLG